MALNTHDHLEVIKFYRYSNLLFQQISRLHYSALEVTEIYRTLERKR